MRAPVALAVSALIVSGAAIARATPGAGAPVSQSGAPAAQLTEFSCVRAVQPSMRMLTVTAVMRPVAGTRQMRMRFDLLSSARRLGHYRPVNGPNLGRWLAPVDPALGAHSGDVWQVPHPVWDLNAPAFYKLRVRFRWLGRNARLLAHQSLATPVCRQSELRPDLAAQSLSISPAATSGEDAYLASVANLGLTGAGPFAVQVRLADGTTLARKVVWLGPRRRRQLTITGVSCTPGSTVSLAVDPAGSVDDFNRANNTLSVACPAG